MSIYKNMGSEIMMRSIHLSGLFILTFVLSLFLGARVYSGDAGPTFTFTATLRGENQIALGIDSASFSETSINSARLAGGTLIFSFDGPEPVSVLAGEDLPSGSDFMVTEDNVGPAPMGRTEIGNEPAYIISWFPVAAIGGEDALTAYTDEESITLFLLDFGAVSPPREAVATFQWVDSARAHSSAPYVGNEVVLENGSGVLVDDLTTDLDCFFCPVEAPSITTPALVGATEGSDFSKRLSVSAGTGELSWGFGATHAVPAWLAIDSATGTLSGNADLTGDYPIEVVVCDSCPDASGCDDLVEQCDTKILTIQVSEIRRRSSSGSTVGWLMLGAIFLAGLGRLLGRRSR